MIFSCYFYALGATPILVGLAFNLSGKLCGTLDRHESAQYLSISTRKLDDLLSSGELKKLKIGRKTLIRLTDLDEFLAKLSGEESK